MSPSQLIAYLNAIQVGEMDVIRAKLDEARQACLDLAQQELADRLREADAALTRADLRAYRKNLATVIARLGHVR